MIFKKIKEKKEDDHHQLLQNIIDAIEGEIFVKDTNGVYQFVNTAFCKDFGVNKDDVIGKDDYFIFPSATAKQLRENDKRIIESRTSEMVEESGELKGNHVIYRTNKVPLTDENGEIYGLCGIGFDITQQKMIEEEREDLIKKLQAALHEIKTLRGILPVCAYCKKIRDDKGYWNQIEAYISDHSEAQFSHSICPECMKLNHPEEYESLVLEGIIKE